MGWIVDQGSDFPPAIASLIESWGTSCLQRSDPARLTTRGWNGYVDASGRRAFRYTTPKKRLTADDLPPLAPPSPSEPPSLLPPPLPPLLHARAVHIICSPTRCADLVASLLARRRQSMGPRYVRPVIVWEPVPDRCVPEELLNCTNALPLVDVCSPNHAELAGFLGADGLDPATGAVDARAVEAACEQLLASMPLQSYTLVVRAGERGCYVARNGGRKRRAGAAAQRKKIKDHARGGLRPDTDVEALFAGLLQDPDGMVVREEIEVDPGLETWFPAYHGPDTVGEGGQSRVVDPTGGGNCFLGALAVALARGHDMHEATAWASVAASFAIEQVGMPILSQDDEGNETWNGVCVRDRLRDFMTRL